jgi:TnpA family transposase
MPKRKILTQQEINIFDSPPEFTAEGRKCFFYISKRCRSVLEILRNPTSEVGFVLQIGYFKAVNKFFTPEQFNPNDVKYVQDKLKYSKELIALGDYNETTYRRHRDIILEELGYTKFTNCKDLVKKEAVYLCRKFVNPRNVFHELNNFLRWKKIEIPKFNSFAEIITESLIKFEKSILKDLHKVLDDNTKAKFDALLDKEGQENTIKLKRYKLTNLKKSNLSTRPKKIKENIENLQYLEDIFYQAYFIRNKLNLSDRLIEYYAQIVLKSQSSQSEHRKDTKYLYLLSFVCHQYCQLTDIAMEQAMQGVKNVLNTGARENRESFFAGREERNKNIADNTKKADKYLIDIKKAKHILSSRKLKDHEKVEELQLIFTPESVKEAKQLQDELKIISKEASKITDNADTDDMLEQKSVKLKNRALDVLKYVVFDDTTSDKNLIKAVNFLKSKEPDFNSKNIPQKFLKPEERKKLKAEDGKLRIALYKAMLFKKVFEAVKSGALSLKYSNKYRSYSNYLISEKRWNKDKEAILSRAGLDKAADFDKVVEKLKKILTGQFNITNNNMRKGLNKYCEITSSEEIKITTPRQKNQDEYDSGLKDLFPQNRMISVFEVLSAVDKVVGFTESFEHWQIKNKPSDKSFFAGIIGYGCNLGTKNLVKISRKVNPSEVENTVNWYFSNDNLLNANDKILTLLDELELPKLYRRDSNLVHTSSDGEKLDTGVDSLNASFSFKYFGKNHGISIYGFIDESHRLFHSTVINPSEREAGYVIDGLLQNDVVKSDIHSTDTHGYSEIVFALTHLIGVSFAPRIKNLKKQQLYSFEKPSELKKIGYDITSDRMIHPDIIKEEWDNILRLVATIKLKEATASQLLKRLSSYSKDHPLYKALKHFGRIIKTVFILKYIDEVELRQMIEKQLNKIESVNKMSRAVFFGNGNEIQVGATNEQLITVGCKRLIENAIICWNYLYLSKSLKNIKDQEKKKEVVQLILNSSIVTWQHINLHGEYNFSDEYLKDIIEFSLPDLKDILAA